MKKVVLITIRYSILFGKNTKGFHLSASQESHDDYKSELFSQERMSFREWLFDNITFPSLKCVYDRKPKDIDFKVVIMTSNELPLQNKKFLENKVKENSDWFFVSYIEPDYVKYGDHILKYLSEYEETLICATVRLDDDDALSINYAQQLSSFMTQENDKTIISFSLGYNLYLTTDKEIIGASELYRENIAAGLAYIRVYDNQQAIVDDNIYTCGNHIKVSEKYKSIDFIESHSFIRVNTETSDRMYRMDRDVRRKRVQIEYKKQEKKVNMERILREFAVLIDNDRGIPKGTE